MRSTIHFKATLLLLAVVLFLLGPTGEVQAQTVQAQIDAACPCNGPSTGSVWRNHGQYVSCVTAAARNLVATHVIANNQVGTIVNAAARSSCGTAAVVEEESEGENHSPGILTLTGINEKAFNPLSPLVTVNISGAQFASNPAGVSIYVNYNKVEPVGLLITASQVSFTINLNNGKNQFSFFAPDASGKLAFEHYTIWAGNQSLPVSVKMPDGTAANNAKVKIALSDDTSVVGTGIAINGLVTIPNVPFRTLIGTATTAGNLYGSAATVGGGNTLQIKLLAFKPVSTIQNNDFSLGTAGWETGTSPVQIIPHVEGIPTSFRLNNSPAANAAAADMDLQLTTAGIGLQNASRTFPTAAGTRNVTLRYRFITSEVPGGYFGSQFNDYFAVTIRSSIGFLISTEQNSMNGLGLPAFDFTSGATGWREISIPVNNAGDNIQVDLEVANVGDGALDSKIVVDNIKETKLNISKLDLFDPDQINKLKYLSMDEGFTFFEGKVRVYGNITVNGAADDQLNALTLEVWQGNTRINSVGLSAGAQAALFKSFGTAQAIVVSNKPLLFELPPHAPLTTNGKLELKVIAGTANGETFTMSYGSFPNFSLYKGTNRYLSRNESEGGDGWGLPSTMPHAIDIKDNHTTWPIGDISNMNGGKITAHKDHQDGDEFDIDIPKIKNAAGVFVDSINATLAAEIVAYLKTRPKLFIIMVDYNEVVTDEFYKLISKPENADALKKVRKDAEHKNHFHLKFIPDAESTLRLAQEQVMVRRPGTLDISPAITEMDALTLFPNPANDRVTVTVNDRVSTMNRIEKIKRIIIRDLYGTNRKMISYGDGGKTASINTSDLQPGVYKLEVWDGVHSSMQQLVIYR